MPLAAPREDLPEGSDKLPGAFRTISEVADDLDVPQHVLRFWETKFTQVRPVKRAGGRRYYRPDDVDLLRGIRILLHGQGYTIKGAQRVVREGGIRFVQSVGRGEVKPSAPPIREAEPADAATETLLSGPDRAVIEAALDDLRACRAAIEAFRLPPEV